MNEDNNCVVYKGRETLGKSLENVYVIYTPKVIKFIYPSQHSQLHQTTKARQDSILDANIQAPNSFINTQKEKQLKTQVLQKTVRKTRIKLVSRLLIEAESQNKNKSVHMSCYSQKEHKLKTTRKIKTYSLLYNHVKTKQHKQDVVIVPNIACDLFRCGQTFDDHLFQAECKEVQKNESRLIIEPLQPPNLSKIETVGSQMSMRPTFDEKANQSLRNRKRIFDKDYGSRLYKLHQSSDSFILPRSRKNIFQHSSIRSTDKSLSFSIKKRIFKSRKVHNSAIICPNIKEQRVEQIQIDDIPHQIYSKWQILEAQRVIEQQIAEEKKEIS